jgi:hypothetical protein
MAERMPRRSVTDPPAPTGPGGVPLIPSRIPGKPGIVEVADMVRGPLYDYLGAKKDREVLRQGHNPRKSTSQQKLDRAFHEVMTNEPSTVARADVSEARKKKMRVAIALNKARKAGVRIPRR